MRQTVVVLLVLHFLRHCLEKNNYNDVFEIVQSYVLKYCLSLLFYT